MKKTTRKTTKAPVQTVAVPVTVIRGMLRTIDRELEHLKRVEALLSRVQAH